MSRVALVSVAIGLAAMPATASARAVRVTGPVEGPRLAASTAVWAEERDGRVRVRAIGAAGRPRTLGAVPALPGRSAFGLALGGGGVAVARAGWPRGDLPVEPDRWIVAPLGGQPIVDCAPPRGFGAISTPRVAGDGATLAAPGAACRGDAVLVRTPGRADRAIVEPGTVVDLRVAVRVVVRCAGGCDGSLHALRCSGRRCIARSASLRLAAGRRKAMRLNLTARTRRLVRRRGARGLPAALKTSATHGPTVLVTRRIVAARRR